ncbi:MAG: rhodanese-like domain-containing protein [Eubacteriales bacterium]|nr:rhodanese-like domain-containing protein [Eubacteriales bacterium]
MNIKKIDTNTVHFALKSDDWVVVDTRNSNSFIGWCMESEKKKGHIKGATDFAAEWITFPFISAWSTKEERIRNIENKFKDKKFLPDMKIILYDTNGTDAEVVAQYFFERGLQNLYYYNFNDWDGDTTCVDHYEKMVPVQWVKNVIDGKKTEFYDGGRYKIFEVSETEEPCKEFLEGHIPGSTHIWVNEFQKFPEQCMASDDVLEEFARNNGITVDTTVIIYAMGYTGASHLLALVLEYMGVKNIHCINGSSHQWLQQNYPVETGFAAKQPVESFGAKIPGNKNIVVKIEEAREIMLETHSDQLVDMRSWEEYTGVTSGYDYVERAGRIPNTLWCFKEHWYLNPDETMGNPEEMVDHWKECGIDLNKRNVFFCGAGAW